MRQQREAQRRELDRVERESAEAVEQALAEAEAEADLRLRAVQSRHDELLRQQEHAAAERAKWGRD